MAAENVISYDTDTIQSIVNTDLSGLSSLNASTYSDEYLTQDFIAKIFDKLNVGDQSALNKWNTIVTQVNGYITSLEDTPVPEDITQEEQPAQEAANVTVTPEEENPLGDVQTDSAINYETDSRFIPPEALAAGVGIGLGAGIGTNPIDGVQLGDVVGTPGVDYTQKPELPKDANMDLHVEGERAPVLPKGPGNQQQPQGQTTTPEVDAVSGAAPVPPEIDAVSGAAPKVNPTEQVTPGVKPELPKDANMDLHVEGERAPVLPKGTGNQPQPQGQTTTPEVDAVSGAAPVPPEIDAVSGAAPKVNPTEQVTPGLKPELPKDANMDLHVEGERAPVLPKGPGNQQQPEHVQNGDVMDLQGTPGVKPELPKDANMDLHVEGERAPVLPKGPGNQQQPEHVQNGDVMDLQGTPGVKPELPKDANMDLHVEGERAPVLPKGSGNQQQPQGQTTTPEVDAVSGAAPVPPEIDAVSGAAPKVNPTEQGTLGLKPELPKDANMDLHVEGEKAPVLPKGPGNQQQPQGQTTTPEVDAVSGAAPVSPEIDAISGAAPKVNPTEQVTPGVKPEIPKDANMDLHVEGEKAPVLPKGPGNQQQPQGQTTTPEVDTVSGAAPVQPEIDAISGAAPKVNPTEQVTPGVKPELPKEPGNQPQPQGQTTTPEVDVISGAAPVPPEIDAVSGVAPTVQPTVQTQPTVEPTVEPAKPGIDVTTDPRFQAKEPEQPTIVPETSKEPDKTTPKQPETPPKPPVNDKPQQPTIPTFDKTNVFNNLINKLGGNGQQQVSLGMSVCKSYMETNNLTTEQFMMGVNDGSIVLTDPNALSFINALKTTASSDYGTISSTEKLIELLVKLFGILM